MYEVYNGYGRRMAMAWLSINYNSEVLHLPVAMEVILPENLDYDKESEPCKTIYLLHDMGENHTSWVRNSSIERYVKNFNVAVVMPAGDLGYYTDMLYG
jgi:S-formylglutathione hydrolase FrmB